MDVNNADKDQLLKALSKLLADRVLEERSMRGLFASWGDLQNRVKGLGTVKLDRLRASGFVIRPACSVAGCQTVVVRETVPSWDDWRSSVHGQVPDRRWQGPMAPSDAARVPRTDPWDLSRPAVTHTNVRLHGVTDPRLGLTSQAVTQTNVRLHGVTDPRNWTGQAVTHTDARLHGVTDRREVRTPGKTHAGTQVHGCRGIQRMTACNVVRITAFSLPLPETASDLSCKNVGLQRVLPARAVEAKSTMAAGPHGETQCVDDDTSKLTLRTPVADKSEEVWRLRREIDIYSRKSRKEVYEPEVDHVWECQLADMAWDKAVVESFHFGPAANTRQSRKTTMAIVNDPLNLNVTTHTINQRKKGPFTRWKHSYEADRPRDLDDCVSESQPGRQLRDDGYWANIERAVVVTYDEMVKRAALDQAQKSVGVEARAAWLEELNVLMDKMSIS